MHTASGGQHDGGRKQQTTNLLIAPLLSTGLADRFDPVALRFPAKLSDIFNGIDNDVKAHFLAQTSQAGLYVPRPRGLPVPEPEDFAFIVKAGFDRLVQFD